MGRGGGILEWKLISALWHGICTHRGGYGDPPRKKREMRTGERVAPGDQELMAVLGGAVAVPCTCNPLQQG